MESVTESVLTDPTVLTALFIGASVLILVYILKLLSKGEVVEQKPKNEKSSHFEKKKDPVHSSKTKKKLVENRWTGRNEKQTYSHPWLLTSLKGHTGTILDINFSSNGKYLTSCGDEDPDPGGLTTESSSSSSECSKENSRPPSVEPSPRTKGLSRRQRKNRRREDSSPPEIQKQKKQKSKKTMEFGSLLTKKQVMMLAPFKEYDVCEADFTTLLHKYILTYEDMMMLGYPIQGTLSHAGYVMFYKNNRMPTSNIYNCTKFDVNAREFVPKNDWNSNDSGQGSGSSSDSGENFESEESSSSSEQDYCRSVYDGEYYQRTCARCSRNFYTAEKTYLTREKCSYHWGRLERQKNGTLEYLCCRGKAGSEGCSEGKLHVWDGVLNGLNGPFKGFVRTPKPKKKTSQGDHNYGVYALDCEMCYTVKGLEVTKVTVVAMDGRLVYDSFVMPENEIVDYNTRFSGITEHDLRRGATKTLREVQNDLMGFINANTILIGHGLENDLRGLRIVHYLVVDTSFCFPHYKGFPYKRSLKSLTSFYLKRDIQCSGNGHNSYEDASACMELMLWLLKQQFRVHLKNPEGK